MRYDALLKMILQPLTTKVVELLTGSRMVEQLNIEFPSFERRLPDMVARLADGRILHLEFQSRNDREMASRMHEYLHLLMRRFPGCEIVQIVLYVGPEPMNMVAGLTSKQLKYEYDLYDIRQMDGSALLASPEAGDRALALLCGAEEPRETVRRILESWRGLSDRERVALADRLVVLSGLRKLKDVVKEEVQNMALTPEFIEQNEWVLELKEGARAEGVAQGESIVLRRLIERRFGPVPEWAAQRIAKAAPGQIEEWVLRVLDAKSLDDVLGS